LQGKCNIDALNKSKHSPLMLAMSEGRTAIVEYLVSKGKANFRSFDIIVPFVAE